ncbi:MAG: hypothetical protein AVDCRST_MAG76-2135, partial [uncultured Acidimicrobiales bacterium]
GQDRCQPTAAPLPGRLLPHRDRLVLADQGGQAQAVPAHRPGRVHHVRGLRGHLPLEVHPHAVRRLRRRGRQHRAARRGPRRPRDLRGRRGRLHPVRPVRRPMPDRRHHHGQGRGGRQGGRPSRARRQARLRLRHAVL